MRQLINYNSEYATSVAEALSYDRDMTDEQINDVITDLEGAHWDDSTDQYERGIA